MQPVRDAGAGVKLDAASGAVVREMNRREQKVRVVRRRRRRARSFPSLRRVPRARDLFRAVAVVDVEVDDGDAFRESAVVAFERVKRAC